MGYQNAITLYTIAYSFPSISYSWLGFEPDINESLNSSHYISTTFPGLILNKILVCPILASIIPRLNSNFVPIALLVAINVKANQMINDDLKIPNYTDIPLNIIYKRILALRSSEVFPTRLKLELCKMWGIVQKDTERGEYKYADYFATYRQEAIDIISEIKSQDPDLQNILSEILLEM